MEGTSTSTCENTKKVSGVYENTQENCTEKNEWSDGSSYITNSESRSNQTRVDTADGASNTTDTTVTAAGR